MKSLSERIFEWVAIEKYYSKRWMLILNNVDPLILKIKSGEIKNKKIKHHDGFILYTMHI